MSEYIRLTKDHLVSDKIVSTNGVLEEHECLYEISLKDYINQQGGEEEYQKMVERFESIQNLINYMGYGPPELYENSEDETVDSEDDL